MRTLPLLFLLFLVNQLAAQQTAISYELNERPVNNEIQDSVELSKNPFAKFIGEWTLKDNTWIQNWGGENDTLKIPQHHTTSRQINTNNSLLSIIDGVEPNGHIFWSYNPNTKEVNHLSSFGRSRVGKGQGNFYGQNNLQLKVSFEGEPSGSYRIYTYEWIGNDEYALNSIQYDKDDKPTGLFNKGNFVRIDPDEQLRKEVDQILATFDNKEIRKEDYNVQTDTISEYDYWNSGMTITLQTGVWQPLGNLQNTFNTNPNIGFKFGAPISRKIRVALGASINHPIESQPFEYFAEDSTFILHSEREANGVFGLWIGHESQLGKKCFFDKYGGVGVGFIQTGKRKAYPKDENDFWYSVETINFNFGMAIRRKVFRKQSLGLFLEYNYAPYVMFDRVEKDFGSSALITGIGYRF